MRIESQIAAAGVVLLLSGFVSTITAQENEAKNPQTISNPEIPVEQLEFQLRPLTQKEIIIEADGWRDLLKEKATEISTQEILRVKANEALSAAPTEEGAPPVDTKAATEQKEAALEALGELRSKQTHLIDRLNAVLEALEAKGGAEAVAPYKQYIASVGGTPITDVTDVSATWTFVQSWLTSETGGLRWGKNIAKAFATIIAFLILAALASRMIDKTLRVTKRTSELLRDFLVKSAKRIVIVIGLIMALSALEVDIGPLLAAIGAAGFVIAFALQGTLSNLASGILILVYRPFDVGDVIEVAGVAGKVVSLNLFSTSMTTFDNKAIVVPNNSIWGDVITNATKNDKRRVDMVFSIGYSDDIDRAYKILEDVVQKHHLVLADPEPNIKMHELADSSVNFICRPWTKTSDYWAVHWDIMRQVKDRFGAEGISIPFPQRDVHIYQESSRS